MSFKIHSGTAYRHRKKRRRLILILLTAAMAITACAAVFFLPKSAGESSDPSSRTASAASSDEASELSSPETSSEPSSEPVSELSSEESSAPAADPESSISSEPSYVTISGPSSDISSEESSDEVPSDESGERFQPLTYDYTSPVPECAPVEDDYFGNAVFVGNSRTQGFVLYSGLTGVTAYTDRGLTVSTAATKEVVSHDGEKITVTEALKMNENCKSVYMMFGINELGWPRPEIFIEKYTALIDTIQESHPDAQIYLESILPVSKEKSDGDKYINNSRIQEFNVLIREMAAEQQVYYLDLYAAMADEAGNLPDDAASDGVHLKKSYCVKWLDYLRTHVVDPSLSDERMQA